MYPFLSWSAAGVPFCTGLRRPFLVHLAEKVLQLPIQVATMGGGQEEVPTTLLRDKHIEYILSLQDVRFFAMARRPC